MGLISEVFISNDEELNKINFIDNSPLNFFKGLRINGLDTVKIGTLQEILTGIDINSALDQQEEFYIESEDGPWIIKLSQEFINSLSKINKNNHDSIFEKWINTEEFINENRDIDYLKQNFTELIELAKTAIKKNFKCYLWLSL